MRRLLGCSIAVAALVLAGGATCASGYVTGMNFFQFTNYNGDGGPVDTDNWNATTNGAIWISTGAGAKPVLNTQDLNFELDYRSTPTSPWVTLTGAYLLSNGVAFADVTAVEGTPAGSYPGYWMGQDGATALGNTHPDGTSPYALPSKGPGMYYLPGTQPTGSPPLGKATQPGMQFNLYAWTGDYNSFAAAAGDGAEVAASGAFQVGGTAYNDTMPVPQTAFLHLPAMVLTVPGDATYDGKVDINDLTIVLSDFGRSTGMSWSTGDFTGDGKVDINDLTVVLSHFGNTVGSAGPLAPVPEPSTIAIVGAALLGLLICACKRARP